MKIELEIPAGVIASMMTSAIESGDPVTTASRGGWCSGIYWKSKKSTPPDGAWWADAALYAGKFVLEVVEVDDESTGHETKHKIKPADMVRGMTVLAKKFPHEFGQVLADNTDAPCADIFLQCILFGEEKYA